MTPLVYIIIGIALRHFTPKFIAALAVKLKRNLEHGSAQWTV